MEYVVTVPPDSAAAADADAVRDALLASDPAALVDADGPSGALRVSTYLDADELRGVLGSAGLPVEAGQIVRQPSNCCGGCGG